MLRKAVIKDAKRVHGLIRSWAQKGKVLERPLNYVYENIRDFWIYEENRKLIGICALHIIGWNDLAEIKSLVVEKNFQKKGVGRKLVESCLSEAKVLGVKNVFTLSFVASFFKKLGFKKISKDALPHKIWSDCVRCVYFPGNCKEEALMIKLK